MSRSVSASAACASSTRRRSDSTRRFGAFAALLLALAAGAPSAATAQSATHPVVREAIAAYEAGELARALTMLDSMSASLSARDGAVRALYRGLIHFAFGDTEEADAAFTLALRLDPSLRLNPELHSPSRIRAFETARAAVVEAWKTEAQAAESQGQLTLASQRWQAVLLAVPDDSLALARSAAINRALSPAVETPALPPITAEPIRDAPVDSVQAPPSSSIASTEEETEPSSDDAAEDNALRTYSPSQAVFLGLVFPGLGEFYTGRPVQGTLFMAGAVGALAAGFLVEKVEVRCLSVPVDNFCPPEDVAGEAKERPLLLPAAGVAALLTVIGAIDAYNGAQRANARAAAAVGFAPRLEPPAVVATSHDVRLELLRLRF